MSDGDTGNRHACSVRVDREARVIVLPTLTPALFRLLASVGQYDVDELRWTISPLFSFENVVRRVEFLTAEAQRRNDF